MQVEIHRASPTPPPIKRVVLELTEDETLAVAAAFGALPAGGVGFNIYTTLKDAGVGHGHPRYAEISRRTRAGR